MKLTHDDVREVLTTYIRAWQEQDPDLILTIFTPDGLYHERVLEEPICGHEGIRAYWESKVCGSEANIVCNLLNTYVDASASTAIVEWEAEFDDVVQQNHKWGRWIAVLEFEGGLIRSFREYWKVQEIELVSTESVRAAS